MAKFSNTQIDEIKTHLPEYAEEMLTKSKGKDKYICPFCNSGTLKNKTGALTIYPTNFYCFSCGKSGDIFNLMQELENIAKNKVIQYAANKYHIYADDSDDNNSVDYMAFYRDCNRHLQETNYHRGISLDTLNRFLVGYVSQWQHPKSPQTQPTPRLIIPTSRYSYLARDTRSAAEIPKYQKKYTKSKVGKVHIFNEKSLNETSVFYIVEGEIDTLSIIDVGGNAVGLGGVSNVTKFFKTIDKNGKAAEQKFIIALDNDLAGKKTIKPLKDGFKERNIAYCVYNPCGESKDCNEALNKNREKFQHDIQFGIDNFETLAQSDTGDYNFDNTGKLTIENLDNFFKQKNISVKYNTITHKIEITGFKEENNEQIVNNAPPLIENILQHSLTGCTTARIASYMEVIASRNSYNPILDKINSTEWDGKSRLNELFNLLGVDKDTEECKFSRIFIKKWLMQCISGLHNSLEKPFSLDIVLVLKGQQGIGKTRFLEALTLDSRYFGDGVVLDVRNKDDIIQALGKWICELGEIASTFKKDIDSLKAFITKSVDEFRVPYGKTSVQYPRMTAFCGTVNDDEFLVDQTGNRRFAVIPLDDDFYIDYAKIREFDFLQLWTEINSIINDMLANGKTYADCFRLNRDEMKELDKRNGKFIKPVPAQREITDIIEMENYNDYLIEWKYISVTEFAEHWNEYLKKYSVQQIGIALKSVGILPERISLNGKQQWIRKLPIRNFKNRIDK